MEREIYILATIGIVYLILFGVKGWKKQKQITLAEHIMSRYRGKK